MSPAPRSDTLHLGFLAIVEAPGGGYVGGLLVTNRIGRPLEFQCTTPVRPNRTQEILYGPTLKPFLFSELIGKTLVERLQVPAQLILVDQGEVLDLRKHVSLPVACLLRKGSEPSDLPDPARLSIGERIVQLHGEYLEDQAALQAHAQHIPGDADLSEPLDRVREALQETLKAAA
jgi:hypothetical protein